MPTDIRIMVTAPQLTHDDFQHFADVWLSRIGGLQAIGWIQRVTEGQLAVIEREARKVPATRDFAIRDRDGDGETGWSPCAGGPSTTRSATSRRWRATAGPSASMSSRSQRGRSDRPHPPEWQRHRLARLRAHPGALAHRQARRGDLPANVVTFAGISTKVINFPLYTVIKTWSYKPEYNRCHSLSYNLLYKSRIYS